MFTSVFFQTPPLIIILILAVLLLIKAQQAENLAQTAPSVYEKLYDCVLSMHAH
jgi:hypothetical protein